MANSILYFAYDSVSWYFKGEQEAHSEDATQTYTHTYDFILHPQINTAHSLWPSVRAQYSSISEVLRQDLKYPAKVINMLSVLCFFIWRRQKFPEKMSSVIVKERMPWEDITKKGSIAWHLFAFMGLIWQGRMALKEL